MKIMRRGLHVGVILAVIIVTFTTFNTTTVSAASTGKTNTSSMYVRTGAGTSHAKLKHSGKEVKLAKNTKVTILKTSGDWYRVSFTHSKKTLKGYVMKKYVTLANSSTKVTSMSKKCSVPAKVRDSGVNIRTQGSLSSKVYTVSGKKVQLSKNHKITILNEKTVSGTRWFYISYKYKNKTHHGYISANYVRLTLSKKVKGYVSASKVTMKTSAGNKAKTYKLSSKAVTLKKNHSVTIKKEVYKDKTRWYQVSFTYKSKTRTAYIKANQVYFKKTVSTSSSNNNTSAKPTPSATPTPTQEPSATSTPAPQQPLSDAEFEASLTAQKFPESYKAGLRALHQKYPNWRFQAFHTNLDWNTVISKQAESTKNVITKNKADAWKSLVGYDYNSDKYNFPWKDNTWVIASKAAVSYYMDPRNFFDEKRVFMFEALNYVEGAQSKDALNYMMVNTPLSGSYSYKDGSKTVNKTYIDTFMEAAVYSGVSPYHLASRVKQEVITSSGGSYKFSNSASGTVSGYTGYYNFFNIGAYDSANTNAVINGLKFAKNGGTLSDANKSLYLIPWNNQYRSILGGSKYLGSSYINKGQNTMYLQKFNVTSYSTYSHQYMTNVEAVYSEALKTYQAYYGNGTTSNSLNSSIGFIIPVYLNMPGSACAAPSTAAANPNPNLKTVSIVDNNNKTVSSTYDASTLTYNVVVDSASITALTIKGTAVNSNTSMVMSYQFGNSSESSGRFTSSGSYTHALSKGTNTFKIQTTAQNGAKLTYTVVVAKK
ncbi:bifunctional autolysin Atl / N-acetylmuramoyl-L-alanine amidase [Lachnospiraceae bacterium KM106-2]|nr:bifunctional autolysin Atl / N-acetylmuramoyl-L-alanine amidase [Lachnospiraceae bacterium KM106-2]